MIMFDDKMKSEIIYILKNHSVIHAALFGSFARGEASEQSDIDLLVELPESKSLLDLVELKLDL
jgi:predicted nucleotidyltransferase